MNSVENWQHAGFGVYVHWPFCAAKCPYCDFNSHVVSSVDDSAWQTAFLKEIDRYAEETPDRIVSSIFFGGGTPSLMQPSVVKAVIDRIATKWTLSNDVEITLEANPTSIEAGRFLAFRDAGVNRVSIGVQALNDIDLRRLGRMHTASEALAAISIARETFDRVSFDLIYARQDQTFDAWRDELSKALDLGPTHLSLYQLTIEDGTVFGDRFRRGLLKGLPDEDLGADLYDLTQDLCDQAGLYAYEVSNHAIKGQESRHNLIYWRSGDYVGIGPGAHGRLTLNNRRFATETALTPSTWLNDVSQTRGEAKREELSTYDSAVERMVMGLRVFEGMPLDRIPEGIISQTGLHEMMESGLLVEEDNRLKSTKSGRPVLNGILRELIN